MPSFKGNGSSPSGAQRHPVAADDSESFTIVMINEWSLLRFASKVLWPIVELSGGSSTSSKHSLIWSARSSSTLASTTLA